MIDMTAFTPWSALAGGALLGLAAGSFAWFNGRIAGISGMLGALLQPGTEGRTEKLLFLGGVLLAPLLWILLSGAPTIAYQSGFAGLLLAGVLVGVGTYYGSGCTSGHGICGLSRLSLRSLVATLCFMSTGLLTVFVLRHLLGA